MNNRQIRLNNETVKVIYEEVYCKFREQHTIIFLCGGASSNKHMSLRDKVRKLLEEEKKTSSKKYKIFYPEDLLIEVLNKTKEADLLSYEQFLANNSHVIVIICESPGSLVELGAFTNNEYTVDKVIAAVDKKHIKDKSFIMLGPIKYLKKRNKLNVVEYGQDEEEFVKCLSKNINDKKNLLNENENTMSVTSIIGMHYFIQLLLYLYKFLNYEDIIQIIGIIIKEEGIVFDDIKILFNASLKLLFQEKKIIKIPGEKCSIYKLTSYGYESMKKMIGDCKKTGLCDRIRVELMYNEFYRSPHS